MKKLRLSKTQKGHLEILAIEKHALSLKHLSKMYGGLREPTLDSLLKLKLVGHDSPAGRIGRWRITAAGRMWLKMR